MQADRLEKIRALLATLKRIQYQKDVIEKKLKKKHEEKEKVTPYVADKREPSTLIFQADVGIGESSKRTLPPPLTPASKKPKVEDKSLQDRLKKCMEIIDKLYKNPEAKWFKDPVPRDTPNYYNVISKPIYFKKIREKINSLEYKSPLEFREDVRLLFRNCAAYNPEDSPCGIDGRKLSNRFERLWQQTGFESQDPNSNVQAEPILNTIKNLNLQLRDAISSKAEASHSELPPMFLERRRLSGRIAGLESNLLGKVLETIASEMILSATGKEVDVDLDMLGDSTILKLKKLVDGTFEPDACLGSISTAVKTISDPADGRNGKAHPQISDSTSTGHDSAQEVKGSTADGPHQSNIPRGDLGNYNESATGTKDSSAFMKDKAQRKENLQLMNQSAWSDLTSSGTVTETPAASSSGGDKEADPLWNEFASREMAQHDRERERQAEEQRRREVEEERKRREAETAAELARLRSQEEERLRNEEERLEEEKRRKREEQRERERHALQSLAGTAALVEPPDPLLLPQFTDQQDMQSLGLEVARGADHFDDTESE